MKGQKNNVSGEPFIGVVSQAIRIFHARGKNTAGLPSGTMRIILCRATPSIGPRLPSRPHQTLHNLTFFYPGEESYGDTHTERSGAVC